jgi:hypothetical protein
MEYANCSFCNDIAIQILSLYFTARFAQDTKDAENNDFSIAVERTAMEKY